MNYSEISHHEQLGPLVTVSMIGGAIRARVELSYKKDQKPSLRTNGNYLDTAPTNDMNRSSLGTAAARENVRRTNPILRQYSALR